MDDEVKIVGYHGTSKECAENIIDTQNIEDSIGDEEWLGKGKYFYDRCTNALEYNMKKYNENREINKPISFNRLMEEYCILEASISCDKKEILDLDEIVLLSKFIWAWEQIYKVVKDDENFQKLEFRDGYIIDYMIGEVCSYKIVTKTFDRFLKNKMYRDKENTLFDKTRIIYEVKQKYICVKDKSCICNIVKNTADYSTAYNQISNLKNMINRRENYEV